MNQIITTIYVFMEHYPAWENEKVMQAKAAAPPGQKVVISNYETHLF